MQLRNIFTVYRKEVTDFLRDRRTILSLIVAPLVVMPMFMLGTTFFLNRSQAQAKQKRFVIGIREEIAVEGIEAAIAKAGFQARRVDDPRAAVESKTIDIGIEVARAEAPLVKIYSDPTQGEIEIRVARDRIEEALDTVKQERIKADLRKAGVSEAVLKPFVVKSVNVAPPRKMTGAFLGFTLGFILVIFMLSGGMYPAIDMTAGEKERRTLEMLLSSAATREEIVLGKLLATLSATIVTSMLSVASFAVSVLGARRLGDQTVAKITDLPLDASTLLLLALASIPMAILAAAVTLSVTVVARSHKEATSYMTPLLFVAMFLGFSTAMPGTNWKTETVALIPVANFCKVVKDLLLGDWSWRLFLLVLAANTAYAAVAVSAAIRKFRDESVLFRV